MTLITGVFIGPDNDLAAVALLSGVCAQFGASSNRGAGRIVDVRVLALVVAADQDFATAGGAGGVEPAAGFNIDRIGLQHDLAAPADQPFSLDGAAVVDDGGSQLFSSPRGDENLTAVGAHQTTVFDQGLHGALVDGKLQAGCVVREGNGLGTAKHNTAQTGGNHTLVAHFRRQQADVA